MWKPERLTPVFSGQSTSSPAFKLQPRDDPWGPPHWHALGDSYSSGPGAGDAYDQVKYNGSHAIAERVLMRRSSTR